MSVRNDDDEELSGYELISFTGHVSQLTSQKSGRVKKKGKLGFAVPKVVSVGCSVHPGYEGLREPRAKACAGCRRYRTAKQEGRA